MRMTAHRSSALAMFVTLASGAANLSAQASSDIRRAEVAERGAIVMPFDLGRSTHVFEATDFGGIQQVVSDDAAPDQIELIREHLVKEAERFSRGDFHDPAMIHGDNMAGMHQLVMAAERLTVTYSKINDGAEIRYEGADPDVVEAIHVWFEAQLSDHSAHARSRRPGR